VIAYAAWQGHCDYRQRLLSVASHRTATTAEAITQGPLMLPADLEMRPLQAHCHLGLGKLYRRTGRLDEARAELATAAAMLREMGMAHWLPEAERELAGASR
jgi:hypothetical protein